MKINIRPFPKALARVAASLGLIVTLGFLSACSVETGAQTLEAAEQQEQQGIAVLLVSHGSVSDRWREMLREVETAVEPSVMQIDGVRVVETAFMEYTEPSIATRMKEFDDLGIAHVIIIPILLTVSSHSFDDIPTIVGVKNDVSTINTLASEGIKRYQSKAKVTLTPLLDYEQLLEHSLITRVKALRAESTSRDGVVVVAYGSQSYDQEWRALFDRISTAVMAETGVSKCTYSWCGHLVHYSKEPTQKAINEILEDHDRALVIPALVAYDEMFQDKIIGGAVEGLGLGNKVLYKADAILPDAKLNEWVIAISKKTAQAIQSQTGN